jgi:hypothetical protein
MESWDDISTPFVNAPNLALVARDAKNWDAENWVATSDPEDKNVTTKGKSVSELHKNQP